MNNTIFISDLHMPYHHRDAFEFLSAINYEYDIKIAKCVGDIADNHSGSFHPTEYGTHSAKREHELTKRGIQRLNELFPLMTVALGNHCIMTERKAKLANIPMDHIKSYNDMYEIEGWDWVFKDYFKVDKYNSCLMVHSMSANTLTNAKTHSHHTVQGHHHGVFGVEYFADTEYLRWSMTVGCLIDTHSNAFNYAKGFTNKKPIIGCGALIEDSPLMIPMKLTKSGRWNNKL